MSIWNSPGLTAAAGMRVGVAAGQSGDGHITLATLTAYLQAQGGGGGGQVIEYIEPDDVFQLTPASAGKILLVGQDATVMYTYDNKAEDSLPPFQCTLIPLGSGTQLEVLGTTLHSEPDSSMPLLQGQEYSVAWLGETQGLYVNPPTYGALSLADPVTITGENLGRFTNRYITFLAGSSPCTINTAMQGTMFVTNQTGGFLLFTNGVYNRSIANGTTAMIFFGGGQIAAFTGTLGL